MIPAPIRPEPAARGPRFAGRSLPFRIDKMQARLREVGDTLRLNLWPLARSQWSGRELRRRTGPARPAGRGVVAVSPYYGNERLLQPFLDHHRQLGVDEFVFLDLSVEGGLAAALADEGDCAVWRPRGEPEPARAIYWLNYLRRRYASGRWCLSLEPNELFVFCRSECRQLRDLTDFLEAERRNHLYALVVEMYGERPAATLNLRPGEHPLAALPYFDGLGYATTGPHRYRNVVVRGGVQRRTLYWDMPRRSPALNRIPLVKWHWNYLYVAGTRLLMPRRLNTSHSPWHSTPTACLLGFALLDGEAALARAAMAESGQIARGGGSAAYPGIAALRRYQLKEDVSRRFTGSAALVDCGLLNPGQWF
ncbi:MAG TPA: glycosyltransferase family 2 protein [Stellaceae bacterium]|nr:glycosyltransferase family 2 protein [Stellaceae bacterium]